MKILAIVGSPRKKGNTDTLIDAVIRGAEKEGAEAEKIYLSDLDFSDCTGCEGCSKTNKCIVKDDMQKVYEKLDEADGLILGSPTYFYNVTGITKCFLDRLYAYEVFDEQDRSVWSSVYELKGLKRAVTVAVCEQEDISDMGFTSETMSMTLAAVGYRSIANIKALHAFKKGEVNDETISEAESAGKKLVKSLKL